MSKKSEKLCDPRLNRSPEILTEANGGGILDCFSRDNFRAKAANDVMSGVVVDCRTDRCRCPREI